VVAVSKGLVGAVTLNLALDVTYDVDRLEVGGSHRVRTVRHRAGGKGVNVARVAQTLGRPALALGLAGGVTGDLVAADLAAAGIAALLTPIAGETRRSVTVVDTGAGDASVFNEPGPQVGPDEWRAFCDRIPWGTLGVLAASGSLPPGLPPDAYAELAARARHHDVPAVIDTSGPALLAAARAGAVVRANAAEVREAFASEQLATGSAVEAGARRLVELGAAAAVITDGAAGMIAVTPKACWRALPVERVSGNPTGAGDACTAVVAAALASDEPTIVDWAGVLRGAVAASAAAVLTPVAGEIDPEAYRRWLPRVVVESL
jgi:tagatose 6-phosphate kinase